MQIDYKDKCNCTLSANRIHLKDMKYKREKPVYVSVPKGMEVSEDKDYGEILIPKFRTIEYGNSGVKRYYNCLLYLAGISGAARDFMDFLSSNMDDNNNVCNNLSLRRSFRDFIEKSIKENEGRGEFSYEPPMDRTIKGYFKLLTDRYMLIPKERGTYQVNPEFFMKSHNEANREYMISLIFKDKEPTKLKIHNK